ncbi:OPT oligopeptide transporter protein-domain-containing protein [Catenaria anguillulae PL171]|uniref:OPT oligopeptide transporter protein-domain-containing protein n=1 Tax=Catenaria anguillulae PL171 TaxID=765915 RepID=A0A1Y2HPL9_9FUNG|nr:OPT oligopeptide transporter protein-domain-containing protein [Catenaria anguillulae PL171]
MTEKHDVKDVEAAEKKSSSFVVDEEFSRMVSDLAPTKDDPSAPSFTVRVWILGTLFCVVLGWVNTIFSFRTNWFAVSSYVATLLAYPLGVILAKILPRLRFNLFGLDVDLNPGPFTVKEHVLIGIFGTTGAAGVYASSNLVVQEAYYDLYMGHGWALAFLFASSALGFGISGMCRKFLIRPAHMIWPTVLPSVALYTAFHNVEIEATKDDGKKHWSQLTMFGVGVIGMIAYSLLGPGYLTTMMANIPLLCFFAPKDNLLLQQLGSPTWGVGMLAWTTDWSYIGSGAMSIPYWSAVNIFVCAIFFHWIITPILWKGNFYNQPESPLALNSTRLFSQQSERFNAKDVIDPNTKELIESKFLERAPVHMSPFFTISYFANFTTLPAALVHTCVWYGKDIVRRFRASSNEDEEDIHCKLIDAYPEVPDTWYYGFFVLTLILMLLTGELSELKFPWWATLFATVLSAVSTVPIAVVLATACLVLLTDLKLGHYLKVPPRHVFLAQVYSQFLAAVVVYFTQAQWMANPEHVQWLLDDGKVAGPGKNWGSSQNHNYSPVIWFGVIVGCVTPIVLKIAHHFVGGSYWALIHPALILGPGGAGGNQGTTLSYFTVATFFQFFMYRYRSGWWKRYNYVLATAFDVGVALVTLATTWVLPDAPEWIMNCPSGECSDEILAFQGPYGDFCHPIAPESA